MKKRTKITVIIASALLLVGIILAGAGYAMGGMKSVYLSNGSIHVGSPAEYVDVDMDFDHLTDIDIDLDTTDLILQEGDRFNLSGKYDSSYHQIDISESAGKLTIKEPANTSVGFHFPAAELTLGGFQTRNEQFILTYPAGTVFADVDIELDISELSVSGLTASRLFFDVDTGAINIRTASAEDFTIIANLGDCSLADIKATAADIQIDTGALRVTNFAAGTCKINSNLGDETLSGAITGLFDIDIDTGALTVDAEVNANELAYDIYSDIGSVRLNGSQIGSAARFDAENTKLTLNVRSNLGDVTIRTR